MVEIQDRVLAPLSPSSISAVAELVGQLHFSPFFHKIANSACFRVHCKTLHTLFFAITELSNEPFSQSLDSAKSSQRILFLKLTKIQDTRYKIHECLDSSACLLAG